MAERGESLTADVLCEKYRALNALYFGPDMVTDDGIALEWARIPHFFYDYYVFQYATGFSAAVAIAARILKEGAPAVDDYKRFLSGGCSTDPISLLKIAGVDMSSPQPVNDALKLFDELIKEMEDIVCRLDRMIFLPWNAGLLGPQRRLACCRRQKRNAKAFAKDGAAQDAWEDSGWAYPEKLAGLQPA